MLLDIHKKNTDFENLNGNNRKIRSYRVNDNNMSYFVTEMNNLSFNEK